MSQVKSVSRMRPKPSGWYQVYFAAVTEPDDHRALLKIYRAQEAMLDRFIKLRRSSDAGELQDLKSALTYLQILLPLLQSAAEGPKWQ
jgi:hypothetical protein